jgi:tetratricopeptide (TPR) repeat protein
MPVPAAAPTAGPASPGVLVGIGARLFSERRFEAAVGPLRAALERDPASSVAYSHLVRALDALAASHEAAGDRAAALRRFDEARRIEAAYPFEDYPASLGDPVLAARLGRTLRPPVPPPADWTPVSVPRAPR